MQDELLIKKQAERFREENGIGRRDSVDVISLVRQLDILAVFEELPDDYSGMAVKTAREKFLLINPKHSIGCQNFSIAHKLHHLFLTLNSGKP